jgi:hypothetical protein
MKKYVKSFRGFINEGELPSWSKPNGNYKNRNWLSPNYKKYENIAQSMTRFVVGDKIVEIESGISGNITSMGDGMGTVTWVCDGGIKHDSYPQNLIKQ